MVGNNEVYTLDKSLSHHIKQSDEKEKLMDTIIFQKKKSQGLNKIY